MQYDLRPKKNVHQCGAVYTSARNASKGRQAVENLEKEGLSPKFMHLDVAAMESIEAANQEVEEKYGRLDVLIHSAGIILPVRNTCIKGYTKSPWRLKGCA